MFLVYVVRLACPLAEFAELLKFLYKKNVHFIRQTDGRTDMLKSTLRLILVDGSFLFILFLVTD